MADNKFYGSLERLTDQEFAAIVDSKYGWSVSAQAKSILDGEEYQDQNPNALDYIKQVADRTGEDELRDSLASYLSSDEEED